MTDGFDISTLFQISYESINLPKSLHDNPFDNKKVWELTLFKNCIIATWGMDGF